MIKKLLAMGTIMAFLMTAGQFIQMNDVSKGFIDNNILNEDEEELPNQH
ncbi:hypothetical protein [Filobacillus milosensis]|nr:hypothetical protein [Filobacillus milosensis]